MSMLTRVFPWKWLLRLAARRYQIIDPLSLVAKIRSFAQPSEIQEPIELLRAGIVFHARGLINTKAIQHNLDWVWPYWVERQFNPQDNSFIPRAFSFSHINLTHRNWTAVGIPDIPVYPLVDPHGLVTPLSDGWSIDCWYLDDDGTALCPSKFPDTEQRLVDDGARRVITECDADTVRLETEASVAMEHGAPVLRVAARVDAKRDGWLIFSLRPYNPEGVQFIEKAEIAGAGDGWAVNGAEQVQFSEKPERIIFSNYRDGDVFLHLGEEHNGTSGDCDIGLVTSAAFFRVDGAASEPAEQRYSMQLPFSENFPDHKTTKTWPEAEQEAARLQIPDEHLQFLYDAGTRSLIHLSAGEVIPGPYTYNRFWFRDACIMLNALLSIGLHERCRHHLETFAGRQTQNGFFHSQDGEWDSNGQVLWIKDRYRRLTGSRFPANWLAPIEKGALWILKKRVADHRDPKLKGLLPPGFSAEHFGPNDNYYWDDFWSVAGLHGAADILAASGRSTTTDSIRSGAADMEADLWNSIALVAEQRKTPAVPVSPNRRLDSGAIGSIVADYPLQLVPPADERMLATADYLFCNCLQQGCFFQDMIHSGINIYMTLELAQVFLRARDMRFYDLLRAAAAAASPTGQWPEAIHPITGGGCMGDGQHGWAIAEFLMLMRNMFVMEEDDALYIGLGIPPAWLEQKRTISYGPTLTPYGRVEVTIDPGGDRAVLELAAAWHDRPPATIVAELPDCEPVRLKSPDYRCTLESRQ